jgi:alpha-ribazole phosphatase
LRLVAIRHAPVAWEGICYGRADAPAPVDAARVAETVAALRASVVRAAEIWTSPSPRCALVAARMGTALGLPLGYDARLMELSFGSWEGLAWDEIERRDPAALDRWMSDWKRARPPGGEALGELEARVREFLRERASEASELLLVTHAGVMRCLRVLERGSWDDAMRWSVPHLEPVYFELG